MTITRRRVLKSLAVAATASALPRFALAEFPPQSAIDNDPLRPRYHLMPKRGWMNDPCAPVYFNGRYHMFFQYNPGASVWGDMHWYHSVSADMVHWSDRPIALAPTPGGADADGVFTGSMVLNHGRPTILYTGIAKSPQEQATLWNSHPPMRETQNLATPSADNSSNSDAALDKWNKLLQPVIASPPQGMKVTGFRDPTPWREADGWYMLLASGEKNKGGDVLLYKSPDLRNWTYQRIFAQGRPVGIQTDDTVDSGETWECPDFFPLGDRHVLIHSTGTPQGRQTLWQTGRLDRKTMTWTPKHEGILNHGPYYAPKTQLDAQGNRILWGWIPEDRPEAEFAKAGWAGCMSLPRVLTLQDGEVRFQPAKQVATLRGQVTADVNAVRPAAATQSELVLSVARTRSDLNPPPFRYLSNVLSVVPGDRNGGTPLRWRGKDIALNQKLPDAFEVRCFVDHSVVEVCIGERVVLTARVYGGDPARLELPGGYVVMASRSYALSV